MRGAYTDIKCGACVIFFYESPLVQRYSDLLCDSYTRKMDLRSMGPDEASHGIIGCHHTRAHMGSVEGECAGVRVATCGLHLHVRY